MAKTNPSKTPLTDLNAVMSFVANRTPDAEPAAVSATVPAPVAESPQPVEQPAPAQPAPAQPVAAKKDTAVTGAEDVDYAEAFLRPVRTRKSKAIYVDEDTHNALSRLTQGAGVGLADLLINITSHHFETFRPAIRQYLNEQERLNKKKLPF